jgi:outer membrane receptor protein involved in Fe transport
MRRFNSSSRLSATASLFALAVAALPATASAQTEEQQVDAAQATQACADLTGADRDACLNAQGASPPPGDPQEESIVVTGSRIPRANFDTAQPAVVIGSEQIEQRGYTNLADALEELPAFGAPGSSPVGAGQGGAFGSGQNFVNFFGLGDQRTLTVVNGRRFVSSNTASIFGPSVGGPGGQVDFNVLPTLLVDRVETIAVGGAPIYGSDAIAGTVNVILKRTFQGLQLDGQASISERGDAHDYRLRGAFGRNFGDGRGNFAISAEYNETGGLDFQSRPGRGLNRFFTEPLDSNSPFDQVLIEDRRIPSIAQFGIPQVSDAFIVLSPEQAEEFGGFQVGVTDAAGNPLVFNSEGELVPLDFGQQTGNLINFNGGNGFVLPGNLLAPTRRVIATAIGQYEITDGIRLFGEAWYSNSKGVSFRDQPEYNTRLFALAGQPAGNFILSINNPFLSPSARAIIQQNLLTSPLAESTDTFFLGRANTDLISGRASSTIEVQRGVFGVDGNFDAFGRDLTFELVGVYGRSVTEGRGRAIIQQNLENAINAVSSGGQIVCAPGAVNAPVASISSTCAPINPFGANISQAASDYVTAITDPRAVNEQFVATASVSGTLFDIWGGGVGFALGVEHREESADFQPGTYFAGGPDPDPTTDEDGDGNPGNDRVSFGQGAVIQPVTGEFHTNEVFAELTVPLIGRDQNIPFIHSLELNGAFRYIDHSLAGGDQTYTVGAQWQPIRDITIRGNFTRSVRAPAITEFFNPLSSTFQTADDPCDASFRNGGLNPANRQANCAAAGLAPNFASNIVDFTALGTVAGNLNLANEKADAWTVGAVVRPRFLPNFTLAVDWVDIELTDAVVSLSAQDILEACYDSPDFPNAVSASGTNFCESFTRDAEGQVVSFAAGFENAASLKFEGLIAELAWRISTPFLGTTSSLNLGINYLYNHELEQRVGLGDITTFRGGIGYSKHQGTANVTYKNEGFSWQWQLQYLGDALNDPDAGENALEFPKVDDVLFVNSSFSYDVNDRFRFSIVVDNVFDTKQPFPVPGNGGTVTYFDGIRGRYFRFGARAKF